jgi:hypothetical protein
MKKFNEDRDGCRTCFLLENNEFNDKICNRDDFGWSCYKNAEETEALLKEWDEKNGSAAEWRKNNVFMVNFDIKDPCEGCIGCGRCDAWKSELKVLKHCIGNYYANKKQTEALLQWHDKKHGNIQDRLKKEASGWSGVIYESVDDLDFRVGDAVTVVGLNGIWETEVWKVGPNKPGFYPVRLHLFGLGEIGFKNNGEGGEGSRLYHGHNLKITVEEKKPVRTVDGWVYLYMTSENVIKTTGVYSTDTGCESSIEAAKKLLRRNIISAPTKVQIPEVKP